MLERVLARVGGPPALIVAALTAGRSDAIGMVEREVIERAVRCCCCCGAGSGSGFSSMSRGGGRAPNSCILKELCEGIE
jgi:hypothetical protein